MKNLKFIAIFLGLIFLLFGVIYFIKQPSYSIKTDGILYVVNKASHNITIFDLLKGKKIKDLATEIEPHEATIVTNPNRVIVTNYGASNNPGKSITVINAATNTIEKTITLGKNLMPHGIISLPQPNKVGVVADIGNHLSIVNIETGIVEKQIATQQDFSHLLVHHPDKPLIYVSNINSGSVSVIDVEQDKVVKIITCSKRTEGIDITPDGSEIWVTNIDENFISIINTETYEITKTLKTGKQPLRLKFSVDGKQCLVSNASDGTVSVYNSKTKKEITTIKIPGNNNIFEKIIYRTPRPVGILMHQNGLYAFVSNLTAGRVEIIDMKNFTIVSSIKTGDMPDGLALIN
ncbi:40-residue YVTN family beta-propeller repeat-containing protein [Lutibacter oricola]|uniref:40-residue YVTN family beta-propeller repeat-containing protein n=1 Tax=Lutibacter oricola TaxID=762486 RepID=A0A1H2YRB1_9FLAO|nr:cytochrome D1 domain-containing protein [Lutibacter oricola]SDX07555.1 40-residue YVTN family beta-propeller repeat-containing protein [Lutibacter oricola]